MPADILERGNIYFVYRPRVMDEDVEGWDDVQRFYMILGPHGKQRYRMITIGRKRLPDAEKHERYWGFVDASDREPKKVENRLDREHYQTKTRGEREVPPARPAGEGKYALYRHDDHTGLAYVLELPKKPGPVQKALGIAKEARYVISVKNPDAPSPAWAGLGPDRDAEYPKRLRERFDGRKFNDVDPPDFLDYPGAEVMLIGAAEEDVSESLEIPLEPDDERIETAEIFNDFRMEKSQHPTRPLTDGEWE